MRDVSCSAWSQGDGEAFQTIYSSVEVWRLLLGPALGYEAQDAGQGVGRVQQLVHDVLGAEQDL
jgi:hypothetical protein